MYGIVRLVMRIRIGVIESGIRVKILIFCQFRTGIQKGLSGKGGRKSGSEFFRVSGLGRPNYCLFAIISVNAADPERLNADPDPILLTLSIIQKKFCAHIFLFKIHFTGPYPFYLKQQTYFWF